MAGSSLIMLDVHPTSSVHKHESMEMTHYGLETAGNNYIIIQFHHYTTYPEYY